MAKSTKPCYRTRGQKNIGKIQKMAKSWDQAMLSDPWSKKVRRNSKNGQVLGPSHVIGPVVKKSSEKFKKWPSPGTKRHVIGPVVKKSSETLNDIAWLQMTRARFQDVPVYQETPGTWQTRLLQHKE